MTATIVAAGVAISRYAIVKFGCAVPRNLAASRIPTIPSRRLTANESSVTTNVTSRTRTGIKYQRGLRMEVSASTINSRLHQKLAGFQGWTTAHTKVTPEKSPDP